jgi:uncharacterized phage protein gp47/JayE
MAASNFNRPTLPQLIATIRSDLLTRFQSDVVLRRLDAEVYGRVQAAAVHTIYGYLDYLAMNILPDLADEDWLIRHANMKRCPRKAAVAASGFVRWEGVSNGITVPTGTIIQRDDLGEYTSTAAVESAAGLLRVPVISSVSGQSGNTDDSITMRLVSPISSLPSAGMADSITGGTDIESLDDWRARVVERWYYTPQGGADADYIVWAKEVAGVTRAWTYRHWMGIGTVGVMVASSDLDSPIPAPAIVNAARDHILPLAPVAGSSLTVFAPLEKIVDFTIDLHPDTPAVRYAVIAELKAMFQRDGQPGGALELSRIREAISIATGEFKHDLISPSAPIAIGMAELPVVGVMSWI